MDKAERFAAAAARGTIRPLSVEQELGTITHLMLPGGITPPPPEAVRHLRGIAESARGLVRQFLIEASAGGSAAAVLTAIDAIGAGIVALYETEFAHQRQIDTTFERARRGRVPQGLQLLLPPPGDGDAARGGPHRRRPSLLSTAETVAGLDARQRLVRSVPCPLLLEGACSAYEVRPLTCRALLSRSASQCERKFEGGATANDAARVPSPVTPRLISASLINGQIAALRDLGLASHPVELISALAALERNPALFVRWLSREDVFARA